MSLPSNGDLASLPLTAGRWVFVGKVDVEGFEDTIGGAGLIWATPPCRLYTGLDVGTSQRSVSTPGRSPYSLLHVVETASTTTTLLRCTEPDSVDGHIPFVGHRARVTALRAGSITVDSLTR